MKDNVQQAYNEPPTQPSWVGFGFAIFAVIIWGGYLAVSRYGLTNSALEAVDITFIRATVAGLIMLIWLIIKNKNAVAEIRKIGLTKVFILAGLVGPPFVYISVSGYVYAPLVHGGVLLPSGLVLTGLLLSVIVLGEVIGPLKIAGTIIMLIGLTILAGPSLYSESKNILLGDVLFFTAGLMWASFAVVQRRWRIPPVLATASVSIVSIAIFSPLYLLSFGTERLLAIPFQQLLIQAVTQGVLAGVIAMLLFSFSVKIIGAAKASMFTALLPVTTLLIGIPLTGESLEYFQAIGTIIVISGLLFGLIPEKLFMV